MSNRFTKDEHLCLKRRFDALLADGKSFFIFPYRVIYLLTQPGEEGPHLQVAISVRKKQFKHAVTRNLIRRRIRESWRQRKQQLKSMVTEKGMSLYVLLVYSATEILPYQEIDQRMGLVIRRLQDIVRPGESK